MAALTHPITIVGPTLPYKGGIAQHTTQLAFRLAAAGQDVELLSWRAQYPRRLYPGELEVQSGEGEAFPGTRRDLAWYNPIGWFRAGLRQRGPDRLVLLCLVTAIQIPAYLSIAAAARRSGARVAVLCHNVVPHDASSWQIRLVRRLFRSVPTVLVHSPAEAEAARNLGAHDVEVAALPFFLPTEVTAVAAPPAPTGRLLFFGFVRPYKGLDVAIEALAEPSVDAHLRAVGEFWAPPDELRSLAERLGVADRVELDDQYLPSDEIPLLFEGVDALVVPYRSGTGSQHPRIGHLAGVPVIATTVGDLPDQVTDGVDGFLCAPGEPAALAEAIRRLYEPGVIDRLRAHIADHPPDDDWAPYLAAVERLAAAAGRR